METEDRWYIDFYGYNRDIYEKLTNDFMDCLKDFKPIRDVREPYVHFRCERVIWVTGLPNNVDRFTEDKMKEKGYVRYKDWNMYIHSILDHFYFTKDIEAIGSRTIPVEMRRKIISHSA